MQTTPGDAIGQRSETVRRANLAAVVRALHVRGPLSRSELVISTGLTRSAIRGLIGELVSAGLVSEIPSASAGTPGRPSPIVRPEADGAVVVGVEINVDSLAVALVGFGGQVHALERVDRPRGHLAVDDIAGDVADLVGRLVSGLERASLLGVGVAVAGIVRRSDGVVRMAPNLGWRDAPLADRLRAALDNGVPIWVANEADLGGLAEHRRGIAADVSDVLYITGEVGVGGNLIVDGRPLVGAAGYAGEIGHMSINPDGARCGCGSLGCWETEIGERALLVRAGFDEDGGRAGVEDVIRAAEAFEPRATAALDHVGRWLGIGIGTLVNVLNPRLVVVGGLFGRLYPLMGNRVEEAMTSHVLPASRELVRIAPGSLGVDAPLLGAAELAFDPLLADPDTQLGLRSRTAVLASA